MVYNIIVNGIEIIKTEIKRRATKPNTNNKNKSKGD